MSNDQDERAYEQQMQWSLGEVEGGEVPPDVTERVLATVEPDDQAMHAPIARSRWLMTAAIVTLGVAALFGVHSLSSKQDDLNKTTSPTVQEPTSHVVNKPEDVAKLSDKTRAVTVVRQSDDVLQAIAERCPKLEKLHVTEIGSQDDLVTDRIFAIAASLPELRYLLLVSTDNVTGEGVEQLAALPRLETLAIALTRLRPEAYEVLPTLPSLRVLDLTYDEGLDDDAMKAIVRCPGLRQLSIPNCNGLTSAGLALATQIPHLEVLEISGLKCSWNLFGNRQPKQLRVLAAANTNFRNEHLDWLPQSLTELNLSNTSADADTCRILTKLVRHLHKLSLSGCDIQDVGVSMLTSFEELHELDLTNASFTKVGLADLVQMDQLCELKISKLQWLTEAHVAPLMAVGINVHISRVERPDSLLRELRYKHRHAIKARRDRFMKR
ncbi:MAG: hypothetical protein ACI91B_002918 [Planctomycetota bacterium]|jgi:hypothetical protein